MNTFRCMSRIFVLTAVMFVSNVNAVNVDGIVKGLESIFNEDSKRIILPAVGVAGSFALYEGLKQQNPVAKAIVAATAGGAVGGTSGALCAGTTSIVISGIEYCAPNSIKDSLTQNLPASCTSESGKTTIFIVFSAMMGWYFGNKAEQS